MNLRAKMVVLITAFMGILFALVTLALIPEIVSDQLTAKRELGQTVSRGLALYLEKIDPKDRAEALKARLEEQPFRDALGKWLLRDDQRNAVAWSKGLDSPSKRSAENFDLEHMDIVVPLALVPKQNHPWVILAASPAAKISMGAKLWSLSITMIIGTVMMGVAVYLLMLRLVIQPVERIAAASKMRAEGRGLLQTIPHSDRPDEIGGLIRSYNEMAAEVNDLRLNLESKVNSAVQDLEAAQKKLVISERLSATGKLAAGVAHEINNPLGGMLNAARTLQKNAAAGSRDAEYLALMLEGLSRIQQIIATMLQFSRPTTAFGNVDLPEVIEGALLFCKHRISELKIDLVQEIPEGINWVIQGNRAGLGQVFLNLLVNALDAMESVEGNAHRLRIALEHDEAHIFVHIEDSGAGMPEDVMKRADEPFFSTKAEGRGTGLGLAIVSHIVEEHKGELGLKSPEGAGTTVTITFPIARTSPEEAAHQQKEHAET